MTEKHYVKINIDKDKYFHILYGVFKNNPNLNEFNTKKGIPIFTCTGSGLIISIHGDHIKFPKINKNNERYLKNTEILSLKKTLLEKLN